MIRPLSAVVSLISLVVTLPSPSRAQDDTLAELRRAASRLGDARTFSALYDANRLHPQAGFLPQAGEGGSRKGLGLKISVPVPEQMTSQGVPPIADELRTKMAPYLDTSETKFQGWHPGKREMLVIKRSGESNQLHWVGAAGDEPKQLSFTSEPVQQGLIQPVHGRYMVFQQDRGGGENFQLYRLDLETGKVTLLTDGKSRAEFVVFSKNGRFIAYSSTQRNGRDYDIHVMDPENPKSDRVAFELTGGGWRPQAWSEDGSKLLVGETISANESRLHVFDLKTGTRRLLSSSSGEKIAYDGADFSKDGRYVFGTSDRGFEFERLTRIDVATGEETPLSSVPWSVKQVALSPDGRTVAYTTNEAGAFNLRLLDAATGKELPGPNIPLGVIDSRGAALEWSGDGRAIGFTLSSAKSPGDAYSFNLATGKLERWTKTETGGLNTETFIEPELVRIESFDGLAVSGFLYRPDPAKFPGKRPVIINIHGGPEAQFLPQFLGRFNYFLNELGIAVFAPNVRGSDGFGKTYLALDNGYKREDSVKDIGAFIQWLKRDNRLDGGRIAVMGGSYGGYMVLASLEHFGDDLRCGVDAVGISNFVTFLENTGEYRRDLRRVEYGDERDPKMREFLQNISPLNNVSKLKRPLLVIQGKNDPRVPVGEAEQIVAAVKENGGAPWYVMAADEGHGFRKKKNADYQLLVIAEFLRMHLLEAPAQP